MIKIPDNRLSNDSSGLVQTFVQHHIHRTSSWCNLNSLAALVPLGPVFPLAFSTHIRFTYSVKEGVDLFALD